MDRLSRFRRFNRTFTQRIGALETSFLGRPRSLGASRVLYEIGADGIEIRTLRSRLGMDSGYLTRLLNVLRKEGLIRTETSTDDSRVKLVALTQKGADELKILNDLSDTAAHHVLDSLSDQEQKAMIEAMETIEKMLAASSIKLSVSHPSEQAAQLCLEQYYRELDSRFENGFDPGNSISATETELTPPNGYFVLARIDDDVVGCGALKCCNDHAEIKRMWVSGSARRMGVGRRIVRRLEEIATENGYSLIRLETNGALVEAQKLYASSGYREVPAFNDETYAHHWFEKHLT